MMTADEKKRLRMEIGAALDEGVLYVERRNLSELNLKSPVTGMNWVVPSYSVNAADRNDDTDVAFGYFPLNSFKDEVVDDIMVAIESDTLKMEFAVYGKPVHCKPLLLKDIVAIGSDPDQGFCVIDPNFMGMTEDGENVYLCKTERAAIILKDRLDGKPFYENDPSKREIGTYRKVDGYTIVSKRNADEPLYAFDDKLSESSEHSVCIDAFNLSDAATLALTIPKACAGGEGLAYFTDPDAGDPILFRTQDDFPNGLKMTSLASDNYLAENALMEDLEGCYTGGYKDFTLHNGIIDLDYIAKEYGWKRPVDPAQVTAAAKTAAKAPTAEHANGVANANKH